LKGAILRCHCDISVSVHYQLHSITIYRVSKLNIKLHVYLSNG